MAAEGLLILGMFAVAGWASKALAPAPRPLPAGIPAVTPIGRPPGPAAPAMPVPPNPWPAPPNEQYPPQIAPGAAWSLAVNRGSDGLLRAAFTSNADVLVEIYSAAFDVFNQRVTGWNLEGSGGPTYNYSQPVDYGPYLGLAQVNDSIYGVMVIAQVYDSGYNIMASGNPESQPADANLSGFATIADLQG